MGFEEIDQMVDQYLVNSEEGLETEHPKLDFKLKWYDLTSKSGISEFIKDTTAIANKVGLDGFIVIGFDPKDKIYLPSKFVDCGLSDSALLTDMVVKRVEDLFDFSVRDVVLRGRNLSIIHIPPSLTKPHVIKNHQTFFPDGTLKREDPHRVYVRHNTTARPATKYDLELMYYDRKNIIPEYEVFSSFNLNAANIRSGGGEISVAMHFTFENAGRRPIAISQIEFNMDVFLYEVLRTRFAKDRLTKPLVLAPTSMVSFFFEASSKGFSNNKSHTVSDLEYAAKHSKENLKSVMLLLTLSNGKTIQSKPYVSK